MHSSQTKVLCVECSDNRCLQKCYINKWLGKVGDAWFEGADYMGWLTSWTPEHYMPTFKAMNISKE